MRRRSVSAWVLPSVALVALVMASCGGGGGSSEGPAEANPYAPPGAGEPPVDVVVVIKQQNNPGFDLLAQEINGVNISNQFDRDSSNNMDEPLVIPPGRIRFFLENVGTLAHAYQVSLPDGTKIAKTRNIGPLKTGDLTVDLAPGTYVAICPLSDHAQRGSKRTLIVDPQAQYPAPPFQSQ